MFLLCLPLFLVSLLCSFVSVVVILYSYFISSIFSLFDGVHYFNGIEREKEWGSETRARQSLVVSKLPSTHIHWLILTTTMTTKATANDILESLCRLRCRLLLPSPLCFHYNNIYFFSSFAHKLHAIRFAIYNNNNNNNNSSSSGIGNDYSIVCLCEVFLWGTYKESCALLFTSLLWAE